MAAEKIMVAFRMAWWFRYYMAGIVFMLRVTGAEPNWERIGYWSRKAVVMVREK